MGGERTGGLSPEAAFRRERGKLIAAVPQAPRVPVLELRNLETAHGPFRAIFGVS